MVGLWLSYGISSGDIGIRFVMLRNRIFANEQIGSSRIERRIL